jgi:hypothetical protein
MATTNLNRQPSLPVDGADHDSNCRSARCDSLAPRRTRRGLRGGKQGRPRDLEHCLSMSVERGRSARTTSHGQRADETLVDAAAIRCGSAAPVDGPAAGVDSEVGRRPRAEAHRGRLDPDTRLLTVQGSRGQDTDGGHALPQAPPRHRYYRLLSDRSRHRIAHQVYPGVY